MSASSPSKAFEKASSFAAKTSDSFSYIEKKKMKFINETMTYNIDIYHMGNTFDASIVSVCFLNKLDSFILVVNL